MTDEKLFNVTVETKHALIRHNGKDYKHGESFVASESEIESLSDFVKKGKEAKKTPVADSAADDKKDEKSTSEGTKDDDWKK